MRNPYDFVRIDWSKGVDRRPPKFHDHFTGLSGRIEGTITTLTPFFIHETDRDKLKYRQDTPFLTNRNKQNVIPGSSLKGLIRSLVETVGYGCWCFPDPVHKHKIPRNFWACSDHQSLCVACRMFGMVHKDSSLMGHIGFEDAICDSSRVYGKIYTPDLMGPQPEQAGWYLDKSGKQTRVAGRKFYYHSQEIWVDRRLHKTSSGRELNSYIEPLDAGNVFTFTVHFDSLTEDELKLLLYTLILEPDVRHKLGYAKSTGLGSVKINLAKMELINFKNRYTTPNGGKKTYEADDLETFLAQQTASYRDDQNTHTLNDLRRIWAWPPSREEYGYQAWALRCQRQSINEIDADSIEKG
jgi:CRISPR/Cas system CSM-associated protein Csm3 (group 7 of RAMP superfamily)